MIMFRMYFAMIIPSAGDALVSSALHYICPVPKIP